MGYHCNLHIKNTEIDTDEVTALVTTDYWGTDKILQVPGANWVVPQSELWYFIFLSFVSEILEDASNK